MSLRDIAAARARSLELQAAAMGLTVEEFYNQCHDENGRFCQGKDGPGRVRDNKKGLKGRIVPGGKGLSEDDLINSASDPEAQEAYQNMFNNRRELEPYYTDGLNSLAQANGGQLEGLNNRAFEPDHAFKSPDSINSRVMRNLEKEPTWTEADAVADLGDTLRYTLTFPEDRYADGVRDSINGILDAGLQFEGNKVMSSWKPGGQYAGINSTIVDPQTNFKAEVQFHTKESFQAKNDLHKDYEYLRELHGTNEDRYDTWRRMTDRTEQVPRPIGIEELEGTEVSGVYLKPKTWSWESYLRERPGDYGPLYASAILNSRTSFSRPIRKGR